jgi:hypothetical protein
MQIENIQAKKEGTSYANIVQFRTIFSADYHLN